jgi:hypothetical protein
LITDGPGNTLNRNGNNAAIPSPTPCRGGVAVSPIDSQTTITTAANRSPRTDNDRSALAAVPTDRGCAASTPRTNRATIVPAATNASPPRTDGVSRRPRPVYRNANTSQGTPRVYTNPTVSVFTTSVGTRPDSHAGPSTDTVAAVVVIVAATSTITTERSAVAADDRTLPRRTASAVPPTTVATPTTV